MRTFLYILSLLLVFQPVGWAQGMTMSEHAAQIEGTGGQAPSSVMAHCDTNGAKMPHSAHQLEAQIDGNLQQCSQDISGTCLAQCIASCVSSPTIPLIADFHVIRQYTEIPYQPLAISYYSHTESPEIRPPLFLRS